VLWISRQVEISSVNVKLDCPRLKQSTTRPLDKFCSLLEGVSVVTVSEIRFIYVCAVLVFKSVLVLVRVYRYVVKYDYIYGRLTSE
jgi:hypothetical protein